MSDLLPRLRPPARRRRGLWTLLGFVVIALGVLVAAFFFARRQIGEMFARKLGAALSEAGVFTTWKSSDWVPGGGIRLQGFALYRDAAKHERLALLDAVTATRGDPSWARWDKVNFKTANTHLLLGSGATETRLERMDVRLAIQPGKIELREFHASLQGLRIEVKAAVADTATKQPTPGESLFGNVNLDWLRTVKEWVNFQSEKDEPTLNVELHSLPDDGGLSLTMTFDGARFQWRGQKWDFVQTAVKMPIGRENSPIEIEHVRIGHGGRKIEIAGAFDPASRVIRISKFDSGIDMLALARAMVPDAVGTLSAASTSGAWQISGTGEIPVDHPESFRWNGEAALDGDLAYASGETNVTLQKPAFSVRVEKQAVTISDFKAGLWEGRLNAPRIQIHLPSEEKKLRIETQLTLDGARSQSVRGSFTNGRNLPRVPRLNWQGAWSISATGDIPVDHPENFRWDGEMALGGDLVYASGETNVALRKPAFSVRVEKQVVSISDFKAGLWEGSLNVPRTLVHLPSAKKKLRFETQLKINAARMQSITNSFGDPQEEPGVVQCDWKGGGEFELASLAGSGALSISGAEFCRMPIVGPMHLLFEKLTPKFHKDEPSTMTVNHRMAGGTLYLDDLKVVSEQFRIEADGSIDLAREYGQFTAKGRLRKIPGLATVLFTSLLEFKGEGPVDDIDWSLKSLPGVDLIGKAGEKTAKAATHAVKGAGRAVKGLIKLPGKLFRDE